MRTIIRLQRHGPQDSFYYKIVLAGSSTRLQARPVEQLGYWFPKKINEHDRSIILNKNRIRHWISNGAQLSFKTQRFLNYVGMYNEPWTQFGRSTIYKNSSKTEELAIKGINKHFDEYQHFIRDNNSYIENRTKDSLNPMFRKIKFLENVKDYFDQTKIEESINKIIQESDNIDQNLFLKTHKFALLKQFYNELNEKEHLYSPIKREYIHNKMNELAKNGLIEEEKYKKLKNNVENDIELLLNQSIKDKYDMNNAKMKERLDFLDSLHRPISESEFITQLKSRFLQNDDKLMAKITRYFEIQKENKSELTQMDVERFIMLYNDKYSNSKTHKISAENDKEYTQSATPITPFPDLKTYDADDWQDLKYNTNEIKNRLDKNDQWFNTPLSDERASKIESDHARFWDGILRTNVIESKGRVVSKTELFFEAQKLRKAKKEKSE